jgi:hypothetical protein
MMKVYEALEAVSTAAFSERECYDNFMNFILTNYFEQMIELNIEYRQFLFWKFLKGISTHLIQVNKLIIGQSGSENLTL